LQNGDVWEVCGALNTLSNFPNGFIQEASRFLPLTMSLLVDNGGSVVIEYTSCCASGRLLSVFDLSLCVIESDLIQHAVHQVFWCSQKYRTEEVAHALSVFVSVLSIQFMGFAESFIPSILELFENYVNDESADARRSAAELSNSVVVLCEYVRNSEVFDMILNQVQRFIEKGYCSTFCEEMISLVGGCVKNMKKAGDVPSLMLQLFENEGRTEGCEIASILKQHAMLFGEFGGTSEAIMTIVNECRCDDSEWSMEDENMLLMLAHILFMILKNGEMIDEWTGIYERLCDEVSGNVCASFIECCPEIVCRRPDIREAWVKSASPLPFLSAAVRVLEIIPELGPELRKAIANRLENLSEVEMDSVVDIDLFDVESVRTFGAEAVK
jgi:hypothetical protein